MLYKKETAPYLLRLSPEHTAHFCRIQVRENIEANSRFYWTLSAYTIRFVITNLAIFFIGVSFGAYDSIFISLTKSCEIPLLDYVKPNFYRTEFGEHHRRRKVG